MMRIDPPSSSPTSPPPGAGRQEADPSRGATTRVLRELQDRRGYISRADLESSLDEGAPTTRHSLHEVATFFAHYRLKPPPRLELKVCRDMACHLRGARELRRQIDSHVGAWKGAGVEVGGVSCLGLCDAAPAMLVDEHPLGHMDAESACRLIDRRLAGDGGPSREHHIGPAIESAPSATGWRIDPYAGAEEYRAVRRWAEDPDFDRLAAELKASDLRGMGGAGVLAGQKWADVRVARGNEKFVVVNGDESEPATFKDREILLRTPHLVLEGLILAGLATGARKGYVFIRHEYHDQIGAMRAAIARAGRLGVCGPEAAAKGRGIDAEVFVSPGGYICGEQSALIQAIEGKRAEPRNKPPGLETDGLWGKPTLVSNVETYAWIPAIAANGGAWYRDLGINGCNGARFFSISGDLEYPGAYEVPIGLTLRELIHHHGGGLIGGQALKAIATSGPSGGFLPPRIPARLLPRNFESKLPEAMRPWLVTPEGDLDLLGLPLDLQAFRDLGLMLGSGLVVYGDEANMLDHAVNASEFFRNESCGKCVPCRLGSQKTVEIGNKLLQHVYNDQTFPAVESLLAQLRQTMELTSICGLGMVAASPLASVLRYFPEDVAPFLNRQGAAR